MVAGGSMIKASLKMTVLPERRNELLEAIRGMLEPTRVERGCLSYRLYEDTEKRNDFILLEEWETQEDLERHIAKENQMRILALVDLLSRDPKLEYCTVSHIAGMELIEDVQQKTALS